MLTCIENKTKALTSNQTFCYPNLTLHLVWSKSIPFLFSKDRVDTSWFWSKYDNQNTYVTLKNGYGPHNPIASYQLSQWSCLGRLVRIHSSVGQIECRQGSHNLGYVVTFKIGTRSRRPNHFVLMSQHCSLAVWSECTISFPEAVQTRSICTI